MPFYTIFNHAIWKILTVFFHPNSKNFPSVLPVLDHLAARAKAFPHNPSRLPLHDSLCYIFSHGEGVWEIKENHHRLEGFAMPLTGRSVEGAEVPMR